MSRLGRCGGAMTLMITRTTRWTAIADAPVPRGRAVAPHGVGAGPVDARIRRPGVQGRRPPACRHPAAPALAGRSGRRGRAGGRPARGPANAPWPRRPTEGGRDVHRLPAADREVGRTRLHARAAVSVESAASPHRALRGGLVLRPGRGGQGQSAVAPRRLPDRQGHVPLGARPGRRLPEGARAPSAPGRCRGSLSTGSRPRSPSPRPRQRRRAPRPVKNDPPRVIVSTTPASWSWWTGSPSSARSTARASCRIVNTWALLLVDQGSGGKHYLRALGRWFEAVTIDGPWSTAARPPAALETAMQNVPKGQRLNLLDDPGPGVKDAAAQGVIPTIYVSTVPAELVQTRGRPDYEPIDGTDLLHVRNASTNILLDTADQRYYRPAVRPVVPRAIPHRRPLGVRPARQAPGRLREDSRDAPAGRGAGVRPGHAAGQGSAHRQQHPPDRRGQPEDDNVTGATYEGTPKFQPIEGTSAPVRGELRRTR